MNAIAIIRTVGERTTDLVEYACRKELPDVHMIENMSLSDGTRKLCEIALDSGAKWVLIMDSDYIPRKGFIKSLYDVSKTVTDNKMFVKGIINDKFLMELRGDGGGPMLQRVDLLKVWLDNFHRDNKLTTESRFHNVLGKMGYRSERTKIPVVAHDYEQHYRDIYRSCFVYGKKAKAARRLYSRWKKLALKDPDFEVALQAHKNGGEYRGKIEADYRKDYGFSKQHFADWNKEPITDFDKWIEWSTNNPAKL